MILVGYRDFVSKAGKPCFVVQIGIEEEATAGFRVKQDDFVSEEVYHTLKPDMILKSVDVKTEYKYGERYPAIVSIKLKEGGNK